jgi:hypothetical protein
MSEEGIRHVFLEVGPTTVLHPFQALDGLPLPTAPGTMFGRGRLDHFAPSAPCEDAFRELRRRLESKSAADGDVRDMTLGQRYAPAATSEVFSFASSK